MQLQLVKSLLPTLDLTVTRFLVAKLFALNSDIDSNLTLADLKRLMRSAAEGPQPVRTLASPRLPLPVCLSPFAFFICSVVAVY